MKMRLVTLLNIIVIVRRCVGECEYSENELSLTSEYGELQPKNYQKKIIRGDQTCTWKFSNKNHTEKPLFVYFDKMNIRSSTVDITIGDDVFYDKKPVANCRLYGVNITDIDNNLLMELIEKYNSKKKYCRGWSVNNKEIKTITFRSFGNRNYAFSKSSFRITYDHYVLAYNAVRPTTTIADAEQSSIQMSTGEQNNDHIAIALLAILLVVVSAALVFVMFRLKKASKPRYVYTTTLSPADQRRQETTSNFPVENYASHSRHENQAKPIHPAASETSNVAQSVEQYSDPYAFVEENSLHASSSNANANIAMYDVPTNNRERAPTATSGFDNPEEPHYHAPPNEDFANDQPLNSKSLDVYAVVQKGNNQQN